MFTTPIENASGAAAHARAGSGPPCPRCASGTPMEADVMPTRADASIDLTLQPRPPLATWRCPECGCLQPRLDA